MKTPFCAICLVLLALSGLSAACTTGLETPSISPAPTEQVTTQLSDTPTPFPAFGPTVTPTLSPTPLTPTPGPSPSATEPVDLSTLPITFPIMSTEIAAYFNQIARPDDTALIPVAYIDMLSKISAGKKQLGYPSWAEASNALSSIYNRIDVIAYNPEHWDQTPESEKENLVQTVQQARKDADTYGLELLVAPDRRFNQEYLAQIVQYANNVALQGQRLQDDPAEFSNWIGEQIRVARQSNPEVKIYVQVGAGQGSAEQMLTAIQTVAGQIDGISIWSNPDSFSTLKAFIALIRPEG